MLAFEIVELGRDAMLGIGAVVIVCSILSVAGFAFRAVTEKSPGVTEAEAKFKRSLDGHE